jgi:peroxiredoxin
MRRLAGIVALCLCLSAPALGGSRRPIEDFLVDLPPKEFEAPDLHGGTIALRDLRGKVVILNFWGIWCPPCREEMPEFAALYRELAPRGVELLAVNTGDSAERVEAFVEREKLPFPVVLDRGASDLYAVVGFPTSYVLDRDGRIRYVSEGYSPHTVEELRLIVEHLLESPEPSQEPPPEGKKP